MAYDYSSDSKLLELPNPYQLQNRLLWLCAALLIVAGVMALWWARDAMQEGSLRLAGAPLLVGLALLSAGLLCAATAARRLRFFFGRGRPASLAPEIPVGAVGGSAAADEVKDILRQGSLTYPEPRGAVEGMLYHWAPALITAPRQVQFLARRYAFNLAAIAATLASFLFSWLVLGTESTRAWIGILYFLFGAFFLLKPVLQQGQARLTAASLIALVAVAILGPVLIGLVGPQLPSLRGFSLNTQAFVMLGTALLASGLAMAAVLAQVDTAPQTRASVEQGRVSMSAPPSTLMDELDRTLQTEWTERIPNRRYARTDPLTPASTPSGAFSGELFEETQPLPVPGTKAPSFAAALADRRHLPLLLLDLYAVVLVVVSVAMAMLFVRGFDVLAGWSENRISMAGNAAILALVAGFCFQSSAKLWGRFNFHSVLVWVEMAGAYQTSRIGTGNNFASRMNTENDVVRTEAMTLRVWRALIESVVFGKDEARQVTAMFSTEKEAKALAAHLVDFARSQSVLVAPMSREDQARIDLLNRGEGALRGPAAQLPDRAALAAGSAAAPALDVDLEAARHCMRCGAPAPAMASFCSRCGAPLGS
jgi:hypothetical protein